MYRLILVVVALVSFTGCQWLAGPDGFGSRQGVIANDDTEWTLKFAIVRIGHNGQAAESYGPWTLIPGSFVTPSLAEGDYTVTITGDKTEHVFVRGARFKVFAPGTNYVYEYVEVQGHEPSKFAWGIAAYSMNPNDPDGRIRVNIGPQ